METLYCLELVYSKNYLISQKYFFWGYSKWLQIKQNVSGLQRGLLSNFWWLKSVNQVKFSEECVMGTEKNVLVKKCLQMGATWDCQLKH